jgi:uncharacterized membrane protein YphA (DoxX/SURF4 family)
LIGALRHPLAHRLGALILGAIFLYAAYDKIWNPRDFARIVYHYQVIGPSRSIPPTLPNVFALTLPWVEAVTGGLLVLGIWRREAALLSALMLVMFLIAVGWALSQGIDVENCGCFSTSGEGRSAGWQLIAGDTLMLAAAIWLARGPTEAATPR